MLSICREFLSNCWQRVMVDCATSEWMSVVSGMPQVMCFVLFCASFIPELVENRLYAYADDSTLLVLSASQQIDHLLLLPLTGTWLGFMSGAITVS